VQIAVAATWTIVSQLWRKKFPIALNTDASAVLLHYLLQLAKLIGLKGRVPPLPPVKCLLSDHTATGRFRAPRTSSIRRSAEKTKHTWINFAVSPQCDEPVSVDAHQIALPFEQNADGAARRQTE
jgi:hypothetical protein